jgi:hypothetical protein
MRGACPKRDADNRRRFERPSYAGAAAVKEPMNSVVPDRMPVDDDDMDDKSTTVSNASRDLNQERDEEFREELRRDELDLTTVQQTPESQSQLMLRPNGAPASAAASQDVFDSPHSQLIRGTQLASSSLPPTAGQYQGQKQQPLPHSRTSSRPRRTSPGNRSDPAGAAVTTDYQRSPTTRTQSKSYS